MFVQQPDFFETRVFHKYAGRAYMISAECRLIVFSPDSFALSIQSLCEGPVRFLFHRHQDERPPYGYNWFPLNTLSSDFHWEPGSHTQQLIVFFTYKTETVADHTGKVLIRISYSFHFRPVFRRQFISSSGRKKPGASVF